MSRVLANQSANFLGKQISVSGWVNSRRDHGGLIFIDLRDHTGILQLVVTPETTDAFKLAESLRDEFAITATGTIREREKDLINPNIPTGEIELVVNELKLLNKSLPLPVNTHDDGEKSGEDLRLKYRYLDLRRPSMQKILSDRSDFYRNIRDYMYDNGFTEISTPILANSSPEGARDFLVPSRLHPGKFYALPQAPQQFKQLLMVGGVDKYFQIAPCFRDEDPRADRLYGDFYQLDMEMAFVDDGETVRETIEPLFIKLAKDYNKKLVTEDIPRLSYEYCLETYGTDKPDLRFDMKLIDLTEVFKDTDFKVFKQPCVKAICVKNGASLSRKEIDNFTEEARRLGAGGLAYILYTAEGPKSPILKFMSETEISKVTELSGAETGDAVFFGADERTQVNKVLGHLRDSFATHFNLKDPDQVAYCWVVDFPFYEWDEKNKKLDFGHNPFSMPKGGLDVLKEAYDENLENIPREGSCPRESERPVKTGARTGSKNYYHKLLAIKADQYDMVMNGYEVASGAVRNYNPEIMYKVFEILGYDREYVESRFGGMLTAFKYGAPPHAGCAPGLDRIFMVLEGVESIRDIVAFPKNGSGVDLMMGSPSPVDELQLTESHLRLLEDEK